MTTSGSYTDDQYADNYPDGVEHHYWNVARNRLVAATIAGPAPVVLDVGCGRGIVVDYLRRHGVECWGSETATPAPISAEVGPYLALGRDARELDPALAGRVTQLLFLDVLEHVADPDELLAGCRAHFAATQRITITVPARTELWTNYDDRFGHLRRYDLDGVQALVAPLSPRRVTARYAFHALYPAIRAAALLKIDRPVEVGAPTGVLVRALHRVVGTGLALEDRIVPGWVPGSSIVAVVDL